jgi:3-oxoacyl-[acyl-carrier protein] reductase
MTYLNEFKDQVVLITGGTKGIGRAISLAFGREGAQLVINFKSDWDAARNFLATLDKNIPKPLLIRADVASEKQVGKLFDKVKHAFGRLDILVNNAGVPSPRKRVLDLEPKDWRRVIDVNLNGFFYVTQLALKEMATRKEGVIVNISSSMTKHWMVGSAPYTCSKAAMEAFTKVLAKEAAPLGIRVNAVSPGLIASKRAEAYLKNDQESAFISSIPLKRLGDPEEVAEVVKFLASKQSSYITGEILYVTGGDQLSSLEKKS